VDATFVQAALPDVALDDLALDEPVDALVGRLILTHLPDQVEAVRRLAELVRPGGVVSFQDFVATGHARAEPTVPVVESALRWVTAAVRAVGGDIDTGLRLPAILREAGLVDPESETCGLAAGDPESEEFRRACEHVALSVAGMLPLIVRAGLATAEEIDVATLGARVRDELVSAGAVLHSPSLSGAWARVPG
jgi:hypothetical protein